MSHDPPDSYVYRYPHSMVGLILGVVWAPQLGVMLFALYTDGGNSSLARFTLYMLIGAAISVALTWWLIRRITIRVSPTEVAWWGFKPLRKEDVTGFRVVRKFGLEWVRIERVAGRPYSQILNLPGGEELGRRILQWLGDA